MKSISKTAVAAFFLIGSSIGSVAVAQNASAASAPVAAPAVDTRGSEKPASSSSPAGPEYVIGPEDVLHVQVWKENDLTATLPVRPDGKISLPLLNDVPAAGLTPENLAAAREALDAAKRPYEVLTFKDEGHGIRRRANRRILWRRLADFFEAALVG